ncbi:MAG: NAD(P)H-binding protein [Chloroflexales bacterium]|nr:NAD(P)H-binding protein [Chloroflexales bacterium]
MTRILVTGGTGTLGREVVRQLNAAAYVVRIMSRKSGSAEGVEWTQADLRDDAGLTAAMNDVDVIIHAASGIPLRKIDIDGTEKLIAAARAAQVKHMLYVSIVGIDKILFAYYKAKLEAEKRIQASAVPWSIVRSTQFHTLPDYVLTTLYRSPLFFVPTDFQVQPIDPAEVAKRLVAQVAEGASGMIANIGGPEVLTLGAMAHAWLEVQGLQRRIIHLPLPGKVAQGFRAGLNTAPSHRYGKMSWNEWLQKTYARQAADPSASNAGP